MMGNGMQSVFYVSGQKEMIGPLIVGIFEDQLNVCFLKELANVEVPKSLSSLIGGWGAHPLPQCTQGNVLGLMGQYIPLTNSSNN